MYVNPLAIDVSQPAAGSPMHSDTEPLLVPERLPKSPRLWYGTMRCHHHVYAFTTGCCLAGMLPILQLNVLLITTHRSIVRQNANVRT